MSTVGFVAMHTPDGEWTVEAYVPPRSKTAWFRLKHGDQVVEDHLAIGTVQRMIEDKGYAWNDLTDAAA